MTRTDTDDELLQRYRQASEQEGAGPPERVREAALEHARMVLDARHPSQPPAVSGPAANQSRWKLSMLAGVAVLGMSALLVLQWGGDAPPGAAMQPDQPAVLADGGSQSRRAGADTPHRAGERPLPAPNVAAERSAAMEPQAANRLESGSGPSLRQDASRPAIVAAAPAVPPAAAGPSGDAQGIAPRERASPLHDAARKGELGPLDLVLAQSLELDEPDARGRTALMLAAQGNHRQAVLRLLDAGANPRLRDRDGIDAPEHARRSGHAELARLIESRP